MTVTHYGNQYYQGLSTDTKPTPTTTAVQALFEETNTGNRFRNSGSAWVLDRIGDLSSLATWIVYKASSTLYKARSGITGLTPYSGTNFKTDIWDFIKTNPARYNHIHLLNADTPYDIPSGSTLDVGPTNMDFHMSGESEHGVHIRPLGNNGCMTLTNVRRAQLRNFSFYTDLGATYTADILRLIGATGGCESIEIANMKMRHDDGTNTLSQTGRSLVMLLSGGTLGQAVTNHSWFNVHDCHFYGSDSAICLTSSSPMGYVWSNEHTFTRVHGTHNKHYFLSSLPVIGGNVENSAAHRWVFRDCSWQTTGVEATSFAMFRFANDSIHKAFVLDGCFMWDPDTIAIKFLMSNSTNLRMVIKNCEPMGDKFMGGTAWDGTNNKWNNLGTNIITREGEYSEARGVALAVTDGATITHGMKDYKERSSTEAIAPRRVFVEGTVAGESVTVTAITTTTFTVAIKKFDPTAATQPLGTIAGTSQTVYWRAEAYN
jgi:hypothetical protein